MSNWRRSDLRKCVVAFGAVVSLAVVVTVIAVVVTVVAAVAGADVAAADVGVAAAVAFTVVPTTWGVISVAVYLTALCMGRRRGSQAPAELRPVPLREPASLRCVRALLPGDEGAAWWAEVVSCLAETPDPSERRRYVRSYRRKVPQLVWTSWAEHLSASRSQELS